ncbi:MAG: ATP synthase epsilon chain (EC [uncultured Sulfurovum sp.]|uniref:ATP synthase epsilon chain n=1 Tax=uncultured Sulfurovum sp. TaxID=269237 RepID=A0A6S6SX27_9BACT|nr:MAG: ATP synthase epsilon chain (EC [uncultured Sulfurovum sp.]
MELMKLEIVTPEGVIFDDEIKQVTVPGGEGEFGVLAGHAAIVSLLASGVITIERKDGREVQVAINGGYIKVEEEKTLCMVDGAVALSGEDTNLAKNIALAKDLLEKAQASTLTVAAAVSKFDNIKK